ncbi:putative holin-like toxin [Heyndrickxia acidicola]
MLTTYQAISLMIMFSSLIIGVITVVISITKRK